MTQLYFHYSNSEGVMVDQRGTAVSNLAEARDHAACVVSALLMTHNLEDWREWVLHVSDDHDEEIFALPFTSVLGKPH